MIEILYMQFPVFIGNEGRSGAKSAVTVVYRITGNIHDVSIITDRV